MAQISLTHTTKVYPGGVEAVADFSLDIPDGRFVVLVGPSGCGKSTTLRMIAGLEEITSGTIAIGERIINDIAPKDRDIAMVFQNYALYPHMTVARNLGFALKMRRTPRGEIDRRVRQVAALLGITELLGRKPRALSGGQRQRVAVGRAIIREPKAFLFDEPLSNLDARLRVSMRAELKALHARLGTTTIYVTHDQEEAMTLGDVVVVMEGGRIRQVGPPLEVYEHPASRFVASFIGSPPMNFLEGGIDRTGDALAFVHAGGSIELGEAIAGRLDPGESSQRLVLGVRPAALTLTDETHSSSPALDATIEVIEPLGDRIDLTLRLGDGARVAARVPARRDLAPGQARRVRIDPDAIHLFETGEHGGALLGAAEPVGAA